MHTGILQHSQLIGEPDGSIVTTNRDHRLLALTSTFPESITQRKRQTQPIYPKDLGAILIEADIFPGARVLEAGTGTGALTMALWRAVGEKGEVISYELREEFADFAQQAIADTLGKIPNNLTLKQGDLNQHGEAHAFDRICLDLPQPWEAVAKVSPILQNGGSIFALCPNIDQAQKFLEALRQQTGYGLMQVKEILERNWTIRGRSLRPSHRMVAHTAFLCFARRLAGSENFETESEGFR